jgi:hypothetical protein
MENNDISDINKINEIIEYSQNNKNHLEQIMSAKLFNSQTKEYILCQIDYFNLVIFYHKKIKELKDEKFSFEYIKIMMLTLQKIKNKLEYILSNFISKNIQYEYEKSISALKTHEKYYEEQSVIFERLNNDFLKH